MQHIIWGVFVAFYSAKMLPKIKTHPEFYFFPKRRYHTTKIHDSNILYLPSVWVGKIPIAANQNAR